MLTEPEINDKKITLLHSITFQRSWRLCYQGEIELSEYNIKEITETYCDEEGYFPKEILIELIPFLVEIINFDRVRRPKAIYSCSFNEHPLPSNRLNIKEIERLIEVKIDSSDDWINLENTLTNSINNLVSREYFFDEVNDENSVNLVVLRIEPLEEIRREKISSIRSYKDDSCVICIEAKPDILFCDCGHLCVCEECFLVLNEDKCPKCREYNKVIRKI